MLFQVSQMEGDLSQLALEDTLRRNLGDVGLLEFLSVFKYILNSLFHFTVYFRDFLYSYTRFSILIFLVP